MISQLSVLTELLQVLFNFLFYGIHFLIKRKNTINTGESTSGRFFSLRKKAHLAGVSQQAPFAPLAPVALKKIAAKCLLMYYLYYLLTVAGKDSLKQ